MKHAGVILYNNKKMSKVAAYFALPRIDRQYPLVIDGEPVIIFFIEFFILPEETPNQRQVKVLKKILEANDITVALESGTRGKLPLANFLNGQTAWCHSLISEIKAFKKLSALIKLSEVSDRNMLTTAIGFLTQTIDENELDLLSDEATSIMLYDHGGLNEQQKEALFTKLMADKGVPSIFYKNIEKIITGSEILIVDEALDLLPYTNKLDGKVLIGKNTADGICTHIQDIFLWYEALQSELALNDAILFNNEILAIIRCFYSHEKPMEFIKKFPYLYMLNKDKTNSLLK